MTSALLIIDVQKAILNPAETRARQVAQDAALDAVAARLGRLQQAARAAGAPVVIVQHSGKKDHRLGRGMPGWGLRDEIAPKAGEPVVHKTACDSFHDTDLDAVLKARGVTHLVIGGCMTQYCVDTTARRAVSMGYDVTLVGDGHATGDSGALTFEQIVAHHNGVLDYFDAGARMIRVTPADSISFACRDRAR